MFYENICKYNIFQILRLFLFMYVCVYLCVWTPGGSGESLEVRVTGAYEPDVSAAN